jgi:hypothetical protein
MKLINRSKSRPEQLLDEARGAVKTISKEVKAIRKALEATAAYKGAKKAARRTPVVKRVPVILAAGGATVVAVKKLRTSDSPSPPQQATGPRPTAATTPG